MKGKWERIWKNRITTTLALCAVVIAAAVGAVAVYKESLGNYLNDSNNQLARAESEQTTEDLPEESEESAAPETENGADAAGQAESQQDAAQAEEPQDAAQAEEPQDAAQAEITGELTADAGQTADPAALPEADAGQGLLVESSEGADSAEAGAGAEAAALHFSADSKMIWPMEGEVLIDYSPDTTTYFQTLDQYRTNPGILIQGQAGGAILAPADARIAEVGFDDAIGNYLVLDLGNGYEATIGQLKDIAVVPEQIVKAGDAIACLNVPTRYFSVEGEHLFLELTVDGQTVDPLMYLQ
ncbi:MAG: M23 family metallopeptidase [Lachnospiraceae bacterium]|nr:M23 family metallopeptidase [Lachnospiraceae bacterium]